MNTLHVSIASMMIATHKSPPTITTGKTSNCRSILVLYHMPQLFTTSGIEKSKHLSINIKETTCIIVIP